MYTICQLYNLEYAIFEKYLPRNEIYKERTKYISLLFICTVRQTITSVLDYNLTCRCPKLKYKKYR